MWNTDDKIKYSSANTVTIPKWKRDAIGVKAEKIKMPDGHYVTKISGDGKIE